MHVNVYVVEDLLEPWIAPPHLSAVTTDTSQLLTIAFIPVILFLHSSLPLVACKL